MEGSKSMRTVSDSSFPRVSLSTGQEKGWSILSMIEVERGPVFLITRSLQIGMAGTPFSHTYLKSSLVGAAPDRSRTELFSMLLKEREGVMNLPTTWEVKTGLGFLSEPIMTRHYQVSVMVPTLKEFARNSLMIPIFGFKLTFSGTTVYTYWSSSSTFSLIPARPLVEAAFAVCSFSL